ncbi:MAG: D-tyrosyl-tRNA(Tyr) deacylase [Bacteroidales bacterium]|nr:D-tyrosyl-tRNA(Tyr) deacylase [Bacteroidales bacterium]
MRTIIQRVNSASVDVEHKIIGNINKGLLVLIGFEEEDNEQDIIWLANKIINLRIFNDAEGKMNLSLQDIDGEILIVSQFTLHASTKKGNRPSFIKAAKPQISIPLYEKFIKEVEKTGLKKVATGEFGAEMKVKLENDGPVTISIDTKNKE